MDRSLNFCMITTFYPPYNFGGDGIFVYRLSNELAKRGHKVDIIHCKDAYLSLNPKGPMGNFPNHPNITVHGLKSKLGFISPLLTQQTGYPLLKKKKIEDILKSKRFDVIHYHNISLVGGPKLLKHRKEITLYTMHEHWLVCPMHVLWKYNNKLCKQRNCFGCSLFWKKPPQLWRFISILQKCTKNVDYFISPSQFTLEKHHEMGLQIPIIHIPHFLPVPEETLVEDEIEEIEAQTKPYFLFVGRLEKIKGLQNLLPAFKDYYQAELLVAGDGEYGDVLRKMAKGNNNVKFLGSVSYQELRKLYRKAMAVIIPSICYEVFGMIIIESFSKKTPVIVNNLGALPDIVKESGGGFVYKNKDELTKAMDILSTQPEIRKELGEKGYKAYRKNWTAESHLKKYFDLISWIAAQKNKSFIRNGNREPIKSFT